LSRIVSATSSGKALGTLPAAADCLFAGGQSRKPCLLNCFSNVGNCDQGTSM
jgi:hypothetical protein